MKKAIEIIEKEILELYKNIPKYRKGSNIYKIMRAQIYILEYTSNELLREYEEDEKN